MSVYESARVRDVPERKRPVRCQTGGIITLVLLCYMSGQFAAFKYKPERFMDFVCVAVWPVCVSYDFADNFFAKRMVRWEAP
jgi:hypothetical protein